MEDLWERRLWHQLTLEVEKFFNDPQSAGSRMRIFLRFVGTFESLINQSKLVGLALLAKEECKGKKDCSRRLANARYPRGVRVHDGCS